MEKIALPQSKMVSGIGLRIENTMENQAQLGDKIRITDPTLVDDGLQLIVIDIPYGLEGCLCAGCAQYNL